MSQLLQKPLVSVKLSPLSNAASMALQIECGSSSARIHLELKLTHHATDG